MNELVWEVQNNSCFLVDGRMEKELYALFRKELGWRPEGYKHIIRQYVEKVKAQCRAKGYDKEKTEFLVNLAKNWDGYRTNVCSDKAHCRCHVKKSYVHFSTGLLSVARSFFHKWKVPYRLVDARQSRPQPTCNYHTSEKFELRKYQKTAVDNGCSIGRGIYKCATGGGKTAIAAATIAELSVSPTVFYVTSVDLLKQAKDEFQKFLYANGVPLKVGAVGGGEKDIQDITVMTVQTAIRSLDEKYEKYDDEDGDDDTQVDDIKADIKDLIRSAKLFMADEVQHWAANTCQVIADASQEAYFRFGLSATPWRDMGDDILIDSCFGKALCNISASFLIREGYLIKPEIYFLHVNNMQFSGYSSYPKIYQHCIKENSLRNEWIAKLATKFYKDGRLPLILVKHKDHGRLLQKMIPDSHFVHGEVSKKKRAAHIDSMRERSVGITIATNIFDEGVDVKPLDVLIQAGSGKSPTRALQRIGRILRPFPDVENNIKKSVVAIDFQDECDYERDHSARRREIYATEEEFVIKDMVL